MENSIDKERNIIREKIKESLLKVNTQAARLRSSNFRLITVSLCASAFATLLAGLTAALGPLAGQGAPAWKITCGAVAGFTALAGLMTGLHQKLGISDRLAKSFACAGRLNSLEISLSISKKDPVSIAKEYEELIGSYPELLL
ncbi:MAG TPA: hypothetical protein VMT35_05635 [Ignavibacteriaceae bacterium]|nr:hypothetical protein [Ignavibacteriaceae bacterium]